MPLEELVGGVSFQIGREFFFVFVPTYWMKSARCFTSFFLDRISLLLRISIKAFRNLCVCSSQLLPKSGKSASSETPPFHYNLFVLWISINVIPYSCKIDTKQPLLDQLEPESLESTFSSRIYVSDKF